MTDKSFEEMMHEIEQIIELMNNDLPLEEAVKKFEYAQRLLGNCSLKLNAAEEKIEQLVKGSEASFAPADPSITTQPVDDHATDEG